MYLKRDIQRDRKTKRHLNVQMSIYLERKREGKKTQKEIGIY